jgi:hypothetical protein
MIEWLGMIIAVCALAFTAYQAYVQRKHNVISVKPHITTFVNRNRNMNTGQLSFIEQWVRTGVHRQVSGVLVGQAM